MRNQTKLFEESCINLTVHKTLYCGGNECENPSVIIYKNTYGDDSDVLMIKNLFVLKLI